MDLSKTGRFGGIVLLALALGGCSLTSKLGQPYSETSQDPSVVNAIRFVNFSGKLGCLIVVNEMGPDDIANTRFAVDTARLVLASPSPSFEAVEFAFNMYVPKKALPYLQLGLEEVEATFGEVLVDKNSTAFVGLSSLVEGCDSALVAAGK